MAHKVSVETLDISKLSLDDGANDKDAPFLTGRCACHAISYQLLAKPLVVHCCHCTYCQRETGSAFALNIVIETSNVKVSAKSGDGDDTADTAADTAAAAAAAPPSSAPRPPLPIIVDTPSASGDGQRIARCPKCYVALWSHYGKGELFSFIKAGTLDGGLSSAAAAGEKLIKPGVHIFTSTKAPWVDISHDKESGVPIFEEFYRFRDHWTKESLERLDAMMATRGKPEKKEETK